MTEMLLAPPPVSPEDEIILTPELTDDISDTLMVDTTSHISDTRQYTLASVLNL